LSLLFQLERQRTTLIQSAILALRDGPWSEALEYAQRAEELRCDEDSSRLLAMIHLMRRDFDAAWQMFQLFAAEWKHDPAAQAADN